MRSKTQLSNWLFSVFAVLISVYLFTQGVRNELLRLQALCDASMTDLLSSKQQLNYYRQQDINDKHTEMQLHENIDYMNSIYEQNTTFLTAKLNRMPYSIIAKWISLKSS